MARKITWFAFFCVFFVGSVLAVYFGIQLISKNNEINSLYTLEQVNDAYEKGREDESKNVDELSAKAEAYKSQVVDLLNKVDELQAKVDEIPGLEEEITSLESQISNLQAEIISLETQISNLQNKNDRLQEQVDEYQDLVTNSYIVTFYLEDTAVKNIVKTEGQNILYAELPTQDFMIENYKVLVSGWKTSDDKSYNEFTVTENVDMFAVVVDNYYEVTFEDFGSYLVRDGYSISTVVYDDLGTTGDSTDDIHLNDGLFIYMHPEKDGYMFEGWSLDGETVVSIDNIQVTSDMVFKPVFVEATKIEFANSGLPIYTEDNIPVGTSFDGTITTGQTVMTTFSTDYVPSNVENVVFTIFLQVEDCGQKFTYCHEIGEYGRILKCKIGEVAKLQTNFCTMTFSLTEQLDGRLYLECTYVCEWEVGEFKLYVSDFYEVA